MSSDEITTETDRPTDVKYLEYLVGIKSTVEHSTKGSDRQSQRGSTVLYLTDDECGYKYKHCISLYDSPMYCRLFNARCRKLTMATQLSTFL